jgi:hypothetical protein
VIDIDSWYLVSEAAYYEITENLGPVSRIVPNDYVCLSSNRRLNHIRLNIMRMSVNQFKQLVNILLTQNIPN